MKGYSRVQSVRCFALVLLCATSLAGCLSGSSEGEEGDALWKPRQAVDVRLGGSVGDGPAANASISVTTADGQFLAESRSDGDGRYDLAIKVLEERAPLLIEAEGGTDIVTNAPPDFKLLSAAWTLDDETTANVNPYSTFAVEIARDLNGGLTSDNLARAQEIVVTALGSSLDVLVQSGPIETEIDETNVAEIIKASEALGEIIRRTRSALNDLGYSTNNDQVVQRLASDLIDTVIDGKGGPRADQRTSAVAILVAAQVSLESMANTLHVNGKDATEAMRNAVDQVSPGAPKPSLDELTATPNMIAIARIGLEAALIAKDRPGLRNIRSAVDGLKPGMEASLVNGLLPARFEKELDVAIDAAADGDVSMHAAITSVARKGNNGTPVAENRPPVISGSPARSALAGSNYAFEPSASDLDDDKLTWSITSKPRWAKFSSETGRLSGKPTTGDVGSFENIRISVSDGEHTASLNPFSITVTDPNAADASVTLTWTPPTENEDGTALTDLAGFRIYWGTESGAYSDSITIDNPGTTRYVVENLTPGTYEFVTTALNSAGAESRFSNSVKKSAQ